MPIDPPRINRERICREEKARRRVQELLRQSLGTLAVDECLGDPFREGDRIVIPILRVPDGGNGGKPDPLSMHALVAAWLGEPDAMQ